jgi:hypothetical protein
MADAAQANPVLYTKPPSDSQTSYFLVPASMLGDLSGVAGVTFKLRTTASGGAYYESGYKYLGDVVLQGTTMTTSYATVTHLPSGDWRQYFVAFTSSDTCWSSGADATLAILSNVTGLAIRAEFTTGVDETWLTDFNFVRN